MLMVHIWTLLDLTVLWNWLSSMWKACYYCNYIDRLEVWPGFVTSILQFEKNIMLIADVSHKILNGVTVLHIMMDLSRKFKQDVQRFREACAKKLVGEVVLTRYGVLYLLKQFLYTIFIFIAFRHAHITTDYISHAFTFLIFMPVTFWPQTLLWIFLSWLIRSLSVQWFQTKYHPIWFLKSKDLWC